MHRLGTTIVVLAITAAACVRAVAQEQGVEPHAADDGIHWLHDLDAAIAEARTTGKPLMAYFTFDTCHWCHKLEDDTFSDQSVIERSRDFVWVKVNRDVTPEPCKRFNMSAYPTLMVLGDAQEKIYRFSGYKLPDAFLPELDEALRRFELYRAGKEWDFPPPRAERLIADEGICIETVSAPSAMVPAGFAFVGDRAFVAHFMDNLYEIDPRTGEVLQSFPLPEGVIDICTDGRVIYGVSSGWTAGKPIYEISPVTGRVVREIITRANTANRSHGAKGIAWADGRLVILEGMRGTLHVVHPETGEVLDTLQTEATWMSGLDWDGSNFIAAARDRIVIINPETGAIDASIPTAYRLRSVGRRGDELWVMEQPVFGYDTQHERVQVWPQPDATVIYRIVR